MILQALVNYYDRLAADEDSDVAPFGFSRQKISFSVVLNPDGTLHDIQSESRTDDKGRERPRTLIVLGQAKPPGAGINPCLLWDNAAYMLGYKADDPKPERTLACFERFKDYHLSLRDTLDNSAFHAVCEFLKSWSPESIDEHRQKLEAVTGHFGVFRLIGEKDFVHNQPAILAYWKSQLSATDSDSPSARCLITNEFSPVALTHDPPIKNVKGTQPAGAKIVSFNFSSVESYGRSKRQGENAPVSQDAAFKYCTALNHLLREQTHRVYLAETTLVFWTEKPTLAEKAMPFAMMGMPPLNDETSVEDRELITSLAGFFNRVRKGEPDPLLGDIDEADTPFYILGLAPNASRISIRAWHVTTVREFSNNLAQHVARLEIVNGPTSPPSLRDLLRITAREAKGIHPLLEGRLLSAVIQNQRYPEMFTSAIMRRIIAEPSTDRRTAATRAASIRAILIKNHPAIKEPPVSFDPTRTDRAYVLGRWFALLEKAQKDALGEGLNKTIKDRFFTAASATPAAIFPRLINLNQHHMDKIEHKGIRINRERQIQEVAALLDEFPSRLSLPEQGLFHLGYYHQNAELYRSKTESSNSSDTETVTA